MKGDPSVAVHTFYSPEGRKTKRYFPALANRGWICIMPKSIADRSVIGRAAHYQPATSNTHLGQLRLLAFLLAALRNQKAPDSGNRPVLPHY